MKGTAFFSLALLSLAATAHLMHLAFDRTELPERPTVEESLPSPLATRLLSLGHYAIVADYYWLRAIGHFGDRNMHGLLYPNLEPFLRRATDLDPHYAAVYKLAGTALTLQGMDIDLSNRLLERGLEYRPDVWEIPYYLAFNHYYFEHDFARAAELFSRASELEGAPEFIGRLATRLAAEAGRPEVGLAVVDSMLSRLPDDDEESRALENEYEARRELLLLEVELSALNRAYALYEERYGEPPGTLQAIVEAGLLSYIPEEPLGGDYRIEDGRVITTNEERRLKLGENARKSLEPHPPEKAP